MTSYGLPKVPWKSTCHPRNCLHSGDWTKWSSSIDKRWLSNLPNRRTWSLNLEQASWCFKCCQCFRSFRMTDLPITLTQIHFREKFVSWYFIYDFFHIWHWICIKFRHFVQFPEIDAEPHELSFFGIRTIGDEYGDIDCSVTSKSIISCLHDVTCFKWNGITFRPNRIWRK